METLPPELRNRVLAETAEEMASLLRFGSESLNAASALSLPPEQTARAEGAVLTGASGGPFTLTGLVTDASTGAPLVNAAITRHPVHPRSGIRRGH